MSDEPKQGCRCARPKPGGHLARWRALSWPARIAALPIFFYRIVISPMLPPSCRFQPTCSTYALEALAKHGAIYGTWLTFRRVIRCHPYKWLGGGEGYDPVPEPKPKRAARRG